MNCGALPGSPLPARLTAMGYIIEKTGMTERILPHAITERFLTEGSTVEQIEHHAGIVKVECYNAFI